MRTLSKWAGVAVLAVLAMSQPLRAADPEPTIITVKGMHCMGCVKKIAGKLRRLPGVAGVRSNLKASTLTVIPEAEEALSPRTLWTAVEKAGYRPLKLEGPNGSFTARPRS